MPELDEVTEPVFAVWLLCVCVKGKKEGCVVAAAELLLVRGVFDKLEIEEDEERTTPPVLLSLAGDADVVVLVVELVLRIVVWPAPPFALVPITGTVTGAVPQSRTSHPSPS